MRLAAHVSNFIGNSDLLRCKKKHMFIEHMLDRTVFQEHKTDGQGFRRYKSLLLQNRHQMGCLHLRNNPYREGHPFAYGECPRMTCLLVDYSYIFCRPRACLPIFHFSCSEKWNIGKQKKHLLYRWWELL